MNRYNSTLYDSPQLDKDIAIFIALVDSEEYDQALKMVNKIQSNPDLKRFYNKGLFEHYLSIAKKRGK